MDTSTGCIRALYHLRNEANKLEAIELFWFT